MPVAWAKEVELVGLAAPILPHRIMFPAPAHASGTWEAGDFARLLHFRMTSRSLRVPTHRFGLSDGLFGPAASETKAYSRD